MALITEKVPENWQELEETVTEILRECGMDAKRAVNLKLPRGSVDVDVVATEVNDGISSYIICECKNWRTNIPREIVHAFRTVMAEIGGNRGYIISRMGFQTGAYEAAQSTNVSLVTFGEFQQIYFSKWYRSRLWQIEKRVGNLNSYYEPFGLPGYDLLTSDQERVEYNAVWDRHVFVPIVLAHFSPWAGLVRELEPPPLPLALEKAEQAGYSIPDEIKQATGYRELLQILESTASEALAQLRQVNPITRGRDPSEIDRDEYPSKA